MCDCSCGASNPGYTGRLVKCPVCSLDIAISLEGHTCPFIGLTNGHGLLDGKRYRHPPCGQTVASEDVDTHRCPVPTA